ncbi:MAG: hypothetical protein L6R39_007318 [Caloplaca ligustica]|nr:MAG: hypothetical protein L6R39_007318 [Caloplaca ligustica]
MADQNISQILAALAAQRPGGTPLQGQAPPQQPPLQNYPSAYPAPTPPAPYALPQPSNSGSLDLSNIKPSSSGSVSLADAVARARGFAAEKGVSYTPSRDNDPRLGGHSYRRSRSRSRSPPRRDNYRDNYNPYRDERRGGDARRDGGSYNNRDRSFSPRRNFSPLTGRGNRSPPGRGGDDGHETITIDSNLVGLIIGRQGENLRRVENETATRVQFLTGPESSGPLRQCKISGTRGARDDAKREIYRIITDNGKELGKTQLSLGVKNPGTHAPALRAGEDATQILVPNRTVGLIIGRGGETIRDLQERSACHVNIVGEEKSVNGFRPVNLIGTPQAAAVARGLIMEIVDSDTKNMNAQNVNRDPVRGGQSMFGGGDEKINDNITVPSEAVGMIIGKGGETIKDMQQSTGCKINVSQPNGRDIEREIGLVGSRGAIEAAKRAIMDKVHAVVRRSPLSNLLFFPSLQPTRYTNTNVNQGEKNRPAQASQSYRPDNDRFNDRNNERNEQYNSPSQTSYGQPQTGGGQQQPQGQQGTAGDAPDPYAAYGGYQNYVALWYQSLQAQGQGQQGGQQAGSVP